MDAFADLAPVADHYASLPVAEAFSWTGVSETLPPGEWYMVAFRSILRVGADAEQLGRYDDFAHNEAAGCEGFVHYYKGPLAADRSCMSFCLWNSREEARAAAARPAHREAVALITEMYEAYLLEFVRVTKPDLASNLVFEPYDIVPDAGAATRAPLAQLGLLPAPS